MRKKNALLLTWQLLYILIEWKSLIDFHNCIRFNGKDRRRTGMAICSKKKSWNGEGFEVKQSPSYSKINEVMRFKKAGHVSDIQEANCCAGF